MLVREGFAWGALLFGPLWLLASRAWLPALLLACAEIVLARVVPPHWRGLTLTCCAVLTGFIGRDAVRFALGLRGYGIAHVVAAARMEGAWQRLLDARPDLRVPDLRVPPMRAS